MADNQSVLLLKKQLAGRCFITIVVPLKMRVEQGQRSSNHSCE